jgi:hypothetical protein
MLFREIDIYSEGQTKNITLGKIAELFKFKPDVTYSSCYFMYHLI